MSRYVKVHKNVEGAGDARPTALQIVKDEGVEGRLAGKVIVITGTTSGIGLETARALSATGATLFLTVREIKSAKISLSEILEPNRISLIKMDVSSFESVRAGAKEILARSNNKVNILVNNAGYLGTSVLKLTPDRHEMHFATHHLGHFLLFQLLKPALLASSAPGFHSRVVNVVSSAHRAYGLNDTDNYDFQRGGYDPQLAYAQSKTAQIYMSNELDRRYRNSGLHSTSVHPGGINTRLSLHLGPEFVKQFMEGPFLKVLKSPEQGAATTVLATIGEEWQGKGGKYLEDCAEAERGEDDGNPLGVGYVSWTYNPEKEARLWKDSLIIVGIDDEL